MTAAMATDVRLGIVEGLPDDVYHADKTSLSSSGARTILDETPKQFRWNQDHPRASSAVFDLGHCVHTKVLGVGAEFVDVGPEDWRSKDKKQEVADVRAAGNVPLKSPEFRAVTEMTEAVLAHPIASLLFSSGQPELSLYHRDPETGVLLRARPDWTVLGSRPWLVDLKTTADASPRGFQKSVDAYGYWQQCPWYTDAATATGLADEPGFIFVAVQKDPPYLVGVHELDPAYVEMGRDRNRQAVNIFAECQATGVWPGFPVDINTINAPYWRTKGF